MLTDRSIKVFDIQQKFGAESDELEGAVRYLMNFIGETGLEILISFCLKDPENLDMTTLEEIKDVLLTIPIFQK